MTWGRVVVVVALAAVLGARAAAAAGFADGVRYVFVASRDSTQVSVIDSRDDRLAGAIDLGLVPSQLETTGEMGRLLAVDGRSPLVAVAALDTGAVVAVTLDFVPTRLVGTADGTRVVAAAPESGRLAVIDVAAGTVAAQTRLAPFADVAAAGDRLVLAPRSGLTVLSLATLAPLAEVAAPRAFATLARSPNGRLVYARATAEPVVVAVDARAGKVVGEVASGAWRAYTNAIGITLVLPDESDGSLILVPSSLKGGRRLQGESGISGVYSGWFDTVAFLPSTRAKSVVVVDQQGVFRGDDITLGASPGRGTVTPDGRKLYLPLTDTNRVAVIDAEQRALAGYVALPGRPTMAVMARTFGICH